MSHIYHPFYFTLTPSTVTFVWREVVHAEIHWDLMARCSCIKMGSLCSVRGGSSNLYHLER